MNFKDIIGPDELDWKVIPLDWKKIGKNELKLGTPMSKDGLEANDASCYGILMDDVEKSKHFQARVIVSGCVDFDKAEEYSGIKISEEAKKAIGKVWSQAGGGVSSWNDLTDKPFDENGAIMPEYLPEGYPYKEQSETVLFAEQPVTLVDQTTQLYGTIQIDTALIPVGGETIEMTIDGVAYKCLATANSLGSASWGSVWKEDIGGYDYADFPFACDCDWRGEVTIVMPAGANVTPTIGISVLTETIHPMAPEFLPAGVGGGAFWVQATGELEELSADKSYDEISTAILNGQTVLARWNMYVFTLSFSNAIADISVMESVALHQFSCVCGEGIILLSINSVGEVSAELYNLPDAITV